MNKTIYIHTIFVCFFFNITFPQIRNSNVSEKYLDTIFSPPQQADRIMLKAKVAYQKEDYVVFKQYNDSLLTYTKKHNLTEMQARALVNQAVYYKNRQEFETALENYLQALSLCKLFPKEDRLRVTIMVNLGNLYSNTGDYHKAIETMEEVIVHATPLKGSELIQMAAYTGLSISYSELNDLEKSVEYRYKVKEVAEVLGNDRVIITSLNNIADYHIKKSNYTEATKLCKKALLLNEKVNNKGQRAWTLLHLGMCELRQNNPKEAIPFYTESRDISFALGMQEIEMYNHQHLAEAYEKLGDFKQSLEAQKKYNDLKEKRLKQSSKATILDKNDEAKTNSGIVEGLKDSDTKKKSLLWISGIVVFLLGGLLFFYIKRKKKIESEGKKLKEDYTLLSKENIKLKKRMQDFAALKQQTQKTEERTSYQNSSLTEEDRRAYMQQILDYMEAEKPYLDFDINQSDLATKLNMSVHHLSEVLNVNFEKNFYNFINIYRVNEAQNLLKDPRYAAYKIMAIGYDAGFNSKTSFNRVFKTHVGLTPTEYQKKHLTD